MITPHLEIRRTKQTGVPYGMSPRTSEVSGTLPPPAQFPSPPAPDPEGTINLRKVPVGSILVDPGVIRSGQPTRPGSIVTKASVLLTTVQPVSKTIHTAHAGTSHGYHRSPFEEPGAHRSVPERKLVHCSDHSVLTMCLSTPFDWRLRYTWSRAHCYHHTFPFHLYATFQSHSLFPHPPGRIFISFIHPESRPIPTRREKSA